MPNPPVNLISSLRWADMDRVVIDPERFRIFPTIAGIVRIGLI